MKQIINLILIVSILIIASCKKDNSSYLGNDNSLIKLDTFIVNNYLHDAKSLYFHEIISDSSHSNYNNTILDTVEVTKILKIIQAVYDLKSPERDTVFKIFKIHGFYCYSFQSISLKVKTNLAEIRNLSNGVIPTGNTNLDNILTTYHFDSVRTYYSYPSLPWLTIYTKKEYNMIPIENQFNKLPQIIIANFNKGCIGDGMNISLKRQNYSAIITFSIGSGDCPAGCIYHKYWDFEVKNGIANFVQTYED